MILGARHAVRLSSIAAVVVVLLAASGCASGPAHHDAQLIPDALAGRLERELKAGLRDADIAGASVAVQLADGSRWLGVAGVTDRVTGTPVSADSPFRLASVTKTYVAALTLRLVDEGVIGLDDRAALNGVPRDATVRQLLNHTSGLPHDYEGTGPWTEGEFASRHPSAVCAPGTCAEYSDLNYIALGLVLERTTDTPIGDLLRDRLDELGLRHTWYTGDAAVPPGTARTEADTPDVGPDFEATFAPRVGAAGAMVATAEDLLDWGVALFDGDGVPDRMRADMFDIRPTLALPCTPAACTNRYGLGVEGMRMQGRPALGHEGSTGSLLFHLPEEGVTVAVLTNRPGGVRALAVRIATALGYEERADVYRVNRDGTGLRRLTSAKGVDGGPAWSPDGQRVVFGSTRDGQPELYLMDADGANQTRITDNPADDLAGRFSPDGSRIIFASDRGGSFDIWSVAADGSDPRRLTDDPGDERLASYAADGRIAFEIGPEGDRDIAVMAAGGGDPVIAERPGDQWHASWSPDGERIAFTQSGEGIWTMRSDGSDATPVPGTIPGDRFPVWGPDGTLLFNNRGDLWTMQLDGSRRQRLLLAVEEEFGGWWSPDASYVVFPSDRS